VPLLDARAAASAHGRRLGAPAEEIDAAVTAVSAALAHPLLVRAAAAAEARREVPVELRLEDGTLVEGVVDLAFRDAEGWTVVDFKTDEGTAASPQVALYARAVAAATGLPARAVVLAV